MWLNAVPALLGEEWDDVGNYYQIVQIQQLASFAEPISMDILLFPDFITLQLTPSFYWEIPCSWATWLLVQVRQRMYKKAGPWNLPAQWHFLLPLILEQLSEYIDIHVTIKMIYIWYTCFFNAKKNPKLSRELLPKMFEYASETVSQDCKAQTYTARSNTME